MNPDKKMTAEERRRLDRQRFIGLETQRKLLNSLVLITPANGPNTELAKNLVLAGVNVAIYDSCIASSLDFQTNFLVGYNEIGQKRGEVIFKRLQQMNPTGKNQFVDEQLNPHDEETINAQFLQRFSMVCTSFSDFSIMQKWDEMTKAANKPYYNTVCAGNSAFCYISLGKEYIYCEPPSKKDPKQIRIQSLSFQDCFELEQVRKNKKKQYEGLQGIFMMNQSQKRGLSYNFFDQETKSNEDMLYCMVELGQDIKEVFSRDFLFNFARLYGVDYCPSYSVIGSIVSQQIIKVVENQQQPAINWIVFDGEQGYASAIKLSKQKDLIGQVPK